MDNSKKTAYKKHTNNLVHLAAWAVVFNGLIIIAGTLIDQFAMHRGRIQLRFSDSAIFGAPLIIGLTLLYLGMLLRRRKQIAWFVAVVVYAVILAFGFIELARLPFHHHLAVWRMLRYVILPLAVLGGLLLTRKEFTVKSDIKSFRQSMGFIIIILAVTLMYGVAGFMLMDTHDFHQSIGFWSALHHTIDQFGLTTSHSLVPYTERARAFVDSLSVISIGALVYALISLFQPLKARFYDQSHNRELVRYLLETHGGSSEEYFKLWPQDKVYFIGENQNAALALKVHRSVALVAGDPVGNQHSFTGLVEGFLRQCDDNDWSAAFIHTEPKYCGFYERHGFTVQKIGEEAVVNLEAFRSGVAGNKYFRNIRNKFEKLGYSIETLQPPHKSALIDRLGIVSAEWRRRPGRDERGFMMGYFTPDYLNQCPVMVARDAAGTIQAFINQIPTYDPAEANFDLLQHTEASPTNINDYLLMNFIDYVFEQGFKRLNLGLCPLVGLDKSDDNNSLIDSALRLAYSKGDRISSFSGLEKFKTKYEPSWSPRYITYRGGIRGFTRTLNALNQAMKVK